LFAALLGAMLANRCCREVRTVSAPAYRSFAEHLDPAIGPKRILSLDGGGLRGVLTLGFLRRIETILRERAGGDPAFRLGDYFDLIGGTSTGAIIAAALSLGMSVDEVHKHYLALGEAVFKRSFWRRGLTVPKYDSNEVAKALRSVFGDRTLGSGDFRTGLMVMSKRYDSGSPWPLTNNPKARYHGLRPGSTTIPNGEYPLWQVVRASAAAPMFFAPEWLDISSADPARGLTAVHGQFVDGGVSTANNPALQLLLTTTVQGYNFNWRTGADQLLVVSVGTGKANPAPGATSGFESLAAAQAVLALKALMDDCGDLVETVMQWLSTSPTAREIDREMGTVSPALGGQPMLSYLRYNVLFDRMWCKKHLDAEWSDAFLSSMEEMDQPSHIGDLDVIGGRGAAKLVDAAHFGAVFDRGLVRT
jgi:predicted acylesterase/phospholipase RssA